MDAKTLEALKASIAKWEMNAETAKAGLETGSPIEWGGYASKGVIGLGIRGCPLCSLFFENACKGCPVMEKTGRNACTGTPYETVVDAVERQEDPNQEYDEFPSSAELVSACEAEVAFLRSLLPAEG